MKIQYDAAHDLLNMEFLANVRIDDSVEMDGVVIDYATDNRIVAIEVLDANASKRTTRKPLELTNLAIVKSSTVGFVREDGKSMAKKDRPKLNAVAHDPSEKALNDVNTLNGPIY